MITLKNIENWELGIGNWKLGIMMVTVIAPGSSKSPFLRGI